MIQNFSNAINKAYIYILNAMYTFLFKRIENRRLNITNFEHNVQTFVEKKSNFKTAFAGPKKIPKINKRRAFNKVVGLGK